MQALEGIRVLDLTIWQQGPMTTAMLADWGADVIKLEGPDSPDPGRSLIRYELTPGGVNAYFETHNRNKRGIVLDLKAERGREVFYRLVEDADVVVQNFRPGVNKRLGIDYETLSKMNPKLIYCSASGFGLKGPDANNPALDPLAQARGGLMSVTGEPETPPTRTFNGFADQVSAFLLSYGIAVALFHRERTGEGQSLDGSLLQGTVASQAFNITSFLTSGTYAGQPLARISRKLTSPLWNHYKAKDGKCNPGDGPGGPLLARLPKGDGGGDGHPAGAGRAEHRLAAHARHRPYGPDRQARRAVRRQTGAGVGGAAATARHDRGGGAGVR